MTKVLRKEINIEICLDLLKERLRYDTFEKYHISVSLGGREAGYRDVPWHTEHGIWMYLPSPWEWNAFGLSREAPSSWERAETVCEFTFAAEQCGAFARDDYGGILLLHTGDLGSGEVEAFWRHYRGPEITLGEPAVRYAVAAHLGAIDVAKSIKTFLTEVARISKKIRQSD